MLINGHDTSTDYEALFELMQTQRVTCFIYFLSRYIQCETEIPNYDTEETDKPFRLQNCEPLVIRCENKEAFINECNRYGLSFILPLEYSKKRNTMESAINLIKTASLHRGASTGEVELAEFLKSCLGFKTDVTMQDILFRVNLDSVFAVLSMADSKQLKELIKQHNPKLYQDIFK